jgi:hypothetical protein
VHFEIDKDAGGRPAYAFTNCAEVSKGHYEVIQQGLCRVQLFQYTKDPIALLEGAKATYPVGTTPSEPIPTPPVQEDPKSETPSHPSAPETPAVPNPSIPEETTPNKPDTPSKEENRADELPLDFSKVDLVGKEFLNKRDIIVEKNFGDSVSLSDDLKFTVKIKNKITGEFFHGTLNQPLLVIANNTNVSLNPVSTVLVSRGFAEITITPKKQ